MDYYVPCTSTVNFPPTSATAVMSAWIGLGGNQGDLKLIQTGTAAFQTYDPVQDDWHTQYRTWVENAGYTSDRDAHYFFDVGCGAHIYVKVWGGNCMYLLDIDNGVNTGNQCYGTATSGLSAEAIAERNVTDLADYPYFADFTSVMFHGVGITDNGSYKAMYQVPHNKNEPYFCVRDINNRCQGDFVGDPFATVSDIFSDPNDAPYDKYNVTWQQYGPPPPSIPTKAKGGRLP